MNGISIARIYGLLFIIGLMVSGLTIADNRNEATDATKAANDKLHQYLPFGDKQSFEDAHKAS